jgi:KUP system potassium uptake protein
MSGMQVKQRLSTLMLGAIGVVYGDIGTSPLYAIQTTFTGSHPFPVSEANMLSSSCEPIITAKADPWPCWPW